MPCSCTISFFRNFYHNFSQLYIYSFLNLLKTFLSIYIINNKGWVEALRLMSRLLVEGYIEFKSDDKLLFLMIRF